MTVTVYRKLGDRLFQYKVGFRQKIAKFSPATALWVHQSPTSGNPPTALVHRTAITGENIDSGILSPSDDRNWEKTLLEYS